MSQLKVPDWDRFPWLEHGFGTRESEGWTLGDSRTWVQQIHSSNVIPASVPGKLGEGDALIAQVPGVHLEIRTADCFPVLFVDPAKRAVGAAHAGWRGVVGRIVPATIQAMQTHYGCDPATMLVAVGPGIGACCFEVGPEVAVQFGLEGRVKIDLAAEIRRQLIEAGIAPSATGLLNPCTRCDPERFHSFRRDGQAAGRMASAIGILRPA